MINLTVYIYLLFISSQQGALDIESGNVVDGALKYTSMSVKEVMTPIQGVFMIEIEDKLSFTKLSEIFNKGYSRIPVYERDRNNVVGLLLAKDLLFVDPEDEISVRSFIGLFGRSLHLVWPDDRLGEVNTAVGMHSLKIN